MLILLYLIRVCCPYNIFCQKSLLYVCSIPRIYFQYLITCSTPHRWTIFLPPPPSQSSMWVAWEVVPSAKASYPNEEFSEIHRNCIFKRSANGRAQIWTQNSSPPDLIWSLIICHKDLFRFHISVGVKQTQYKITSTARSWYSLHLFLQCFPLWPIVMQRTIIMGGLEGSCQVVLSWKSVPRQLNHRRELFFRSKCQFLAPFLQITFHIWLWISILGRLQIG